MKGVGRFPPIIENSTEKTSEHEMEAGNTYYIAVISLRILEPPTYSRIRCAFLICVYRQGIFLLRSTTKEGYPMTVTEFKLS